MKVSAKGVCEIAEHEGIVVAPYYDSVGVLTWGVGHTANAGGLDPKNLPLAMPKNIDLAIKEAIRVFAQDLEKYADRVNKAVKVPVKQHQFDALNSFDFNTGGIFKANLTKLLNAGDVKGAAAAFMGWLRPAEIRKRRTAEMNLFLTGNYDANGDRIPVWGTNGKGKLTNVIKYISGKDLLSNLESNGVKPTAQPSKGFLAVLLEMIIQLLTRK
nr:MAG TPA: Lysozyme [Caudoviricetes sp.]